MAKVKIVGLSDLKNLAESKQYYGGLLEVAKELALPPNTVRRVIEQYNKCASKEGKPHLTYKNRRV